MIRANAEPKTMAASVELFHQVISELLQLTQGMAPRPQHQSLWMTEQGAEGFTMYFDVDEPSLHPDRRVVVPLKTPETVGMQFAIGDEGIHVRAQPHLLDHDLIGARSGRLRGV
jgi:hypothetical protein